MRDIAPAYVGVIKEFGWRHVVMVVQNENLFTKVCDCHYIMRIAISVYASSA